MSEICVEFDSVRKSYDGKVFVVKDLNLQVHKGEFVTMLGPSGSGKTSCLMLLAGFESVTSGEIYIDGKPVKSVAPYKRNIGMVFQNYALFPHLTVGQNLAYPLKFRKYSKEQIKNQVNKYLGLVELEDFADRYPGQLSGGQRQRVALARSLVFEPELVLMDEPLAALDKNLREQMQYEVKKLHEMLGFTAIYVTHDQSESLTMSDRITLFNNGIIEQASDPKTIYEEPVNKFVAEFLGENNRISCDLNSIKDGIANVSIKDNMNVNAKAIDITKNCKKIDLFVRPEKLLINPREHHKCENNLKAKIRKIIYIGDHLRIYVVLDDASVELIVKQPNFAALRSYKVGQEIIVAWKTKDCRAMKK